MIPSQYDVAYFNPKTSHRIYIDIPVRTGQLITGGFSHTTDTFLTHLEAVEGTLQFYLADDIDPEDWIDDIILEASPPVHITEKECQDRSGCVNYNLNSKIQTEICQRVTDCPSPSLISCTNAFQPQGHCCSICGDWQYQLNLIKGRVDIDFDENWIKEKTEILKKLLIDKINGVLDETLQITYATARSHAVALGLGLFCLFAFLIGVAIGGYKKKTVIQNWFIGNRIQLRAQWRDDHSDRIHLEMADPHARGSISSASMTSFENPTFNNLMAQEEDKAVMAAVYAKFSL